LRDLRWIRGEFLSHQGAHGRIVVHGHTITETVHERENRIGIDTGAYESNVLTALGLEGEARWFLDTADGNDRAIPSL
jgi:serine/threonine protein phosphatase 1